MGKRERHALVGESGAEIRKRVDRMHALYRAGRGGIDAEDPAMRMRAAHESRVEHVRKLDVVDVSSTTGDELGVFLALDLRAQITNAHGRLSPFRMDAAAESAAVTMG